MNNLRQKRNTYEFQNLSVFGNNIQVHGKHFFSNCRVVYKHGCPRLQSFSEKNIKHKKIELIKIIIIK